MTLRRSRGGSAQQSPTTIADLAVRYHALHWLLLGQDNVTMDDEGEEAFLAFGRALRRLVSRRD